MTPQSVLDALKAVTDPDLGVDVVALKFVKEKDIALDGGRVAIAMELATPSAAKREALTARVRATVGALPGVASAIWSPSSDRPRGARSRVIWGCAASLPISAA